MLCLCCDLSGTVVYKFDIRQKMEVISQGKCIALNIPSYRNRQGLGMTSDACFPLCFSLYGDSSKIYSLVEVVHVSSSSAVFHYFEIDCCLKVLLSHEVCY